MEVTIPWSMLLLIFVQGINWLYIDYRERLSWSVIGIGHVKLCGHNKAITCLSLSVWRHDKETLSALLAHCEGNPPVTGGFPSYRVSNVVVLSVIWDALTLMWRHCYAVKDVCCGQWLILSLLIHLVWRENNKAISPQSVSVNCN